VDVDEARRDERAVGLDLPRPAAVDRPDLGDHPVGDGDIGGEPRRPRPVDDGAPSDDQIVRCHASPSVLLGTASQVELRG
jgi:hypothetical protein